MKRLATFARHLSSDLVKLRAPVTAAALVATGAALVEPFGITLGGETTAKVTGALVAVGVLWAYVTERAGGVEVRTNPATTVESRAKSIASELAMGLRLRDLPADELRHAIAAHRTAIEVAGDVRVLDPDQQRAAAKHDADQKLWELIA